MQIIHTVSEWRQIRSTLNSTLGLVPTMGNLHQGHQRLLEKSVTDNAVTVLSIFVNPTQFDEQNDLQNYPRTLSEDCQLAEQSGIDYVFAPNYHDLYPDNYSYKVSELTLSQSLCGKARPGHFDGVLTVVLKLLQIIKPHHAYFGEKDYQQLQLIQGMVQAFFLDIEIIACPTVRDAQGLALSSRNNRLTPAQYQQALAFPRLLARNTTCQEIINQLQAQGFVVDYLEEQHGRRYGAVRIGDIRLIDNIKIS